MGLFILQERIATLRRNLKRAKAASLTRLELHNVQVDDGPWMKAFNEIRRNSTEELKQLDALDADVEKGELDASEAWKKFSEIECLSEELFRECLEMLGGLVFREMKLDEQICRFADELIKECATSVANVPAFVIPSPDRVPPVDMRHVAHVRFPEWDLWALPLVAHEYGRVAIAGSDHARELVGKLAQAQYAELSGDADVLPEDVERRVQLLLADAFATFTTGPAYACALLLLRLDMVGASPAERAFVGQRADMVTGIVDALGPKGLVDTQIRGPLMSRWEEAVASQPPAAADSTDPLAPLDLDPAEVHAALKDAFYPGAAYTTANWHTAMQWGEEWKAQLGNDEEPSVPRDVMAAHRLRDALNASWYVRIGDADWETKGVRVTRLLCQKIIDVRAAAASGSGDKVRGTSRPEQGG